MKLHERLHFIQASRLAPSRKHLVSVIAGFLGSDDDGPAYPSVVTMAKLTSMSEAQVHNLLREMMADGLITRHDGGKRALFTCIRWGAIAAHAPAASGRGGVRVKTPKTGASESAPLDDDTKDWCRETPKTGGWGPKTGAHTPKTAPDQIMNRSEIRPEDQTSGVRAMPANPHLLTALLFATRSDPMPTDRPGSRPTMDTDPIDNDGATTHPPGSAAPSLPLTDPERPATSETSATPDPDKLWSLRSGDGVAPPKPKRKAKTATALDLDAWGLACQSYDTISGKMRKWDPARGDGRLLAETMAAQGQARIVARFAQAARDPWCLDKRPDVSALCRMGNGIVARLDAAAEQAALDAESRSEAVAASTGTLACRIAQNAPERQAAPKQPVSWPDVLRDLGSDPDHHPDDGPMREHWPRVREAIYSATKSSGDAWLTWCRADDTKRQRVERVLSLVTA